MAAVDIHSLAGAYALDAVDDVERAAFERHLRDCATCSLEVAELRETAAWLSHPVAAAPPASLRDAVLAQIAQTPQERPRRTSSGASGPSSGERRWRRWTASAVAAAVIGLGVGGGTWIVSEHRLDRERTAAARVQAVLTAADATLVHKDLAGGRVSLVVSESRNAAVAVLDGLQAPGPGRAYQLWMVGGGALGAISVGLLPSNAGSGQTYINDLHGASSFAISNEIDRGAETPSQPPVGSLRFGP
jgi:anti-sigma-K factor RskA